MPWVVHLQIESAPSGLFVQNKMDGSKGWRHLLRDKGQFGSFPSFDPMDDESSS
jgi:hypothetical protein